MNNGVCFWISDFFFIYIYINIASLKIKRLSPFFVHCPPLTKSVLAVGGMLLPLGSNRNSMTELNMFSVVMMNSSCELQLLNYRLEPRLQTTCMKPFKYLLKDPNHTAFYVVLIHLVSMTRDYISSLSMFGTMRPLPPPPVCRAADALYNT